jgi:hypothetical protein
MILALLATVGTLFAQGGWRRFGGAPPIPAAQQAMAESSQDPTQPVDRSDSQLQAPAPNLPHDPPRYGLPAQLTIKPGTFATVRVDQMLSSNRNQAGDVFSATLTQPIVVDGVVVAQRGQTVMGGVAEAQKSNAGHDARLGLELTGLTLVDGTQAELRSQLVSWEGGRTPSGAQAGTVIGTTALGAGIGGAVGWGTGAAIGGGAGLAVGAIAALVTRNHPTVVYPETAMTFRLDAPLEISTARAPQAFRYVSPNDYSRPAPMQTRAAGPMSPYGAYYGPYAAPYPYGVYPYPYPYPYGYWGPGVGLVFGRGFRRW